VKSAKQRLMVFDTNLIIQHIRRYQQLPDRAVIPMVVAGELEALALKADWGYQKVAFMQSILDYYPLVEVSRALTPLYAQTDAYSQGKLKLHPLPPGMSARNMGKNDLWIAATALYFDMELHTTDNDFDHLSGFDLQLVKS
jgi:predicted nucleic acid-binding protein